MSTPVAGSLSVTPLYTTPADVMVSWDDVNATWRSLPSVSLPMTVAGGGTGQTTLALNRPLIGNGTSPVLSSTIVTDNGTTLQVSTNVVIGNPVTSPPAHALVVNDAATMPQAYGAGVPRVWGAAETSAALALMDSYGASAAQYIGRRSRGTAAAPTAVQSGDNLMVVGASGRGATNYSGNVPALIALATENWSDTAQGVAIAFNTTTNTTTATNERMRIDHNGNVGIGTTTPNSKFTVHVGTNQNFMVAQNASLTTIGVLNDAGSGWVPLQINPGGPVYVGGPVGIGTTTPVASLDITGNGDIALNANHLIFGGLYFDYGASAWKYKQAAGTPGSGLKFSSSEPLFQFIAATAAGNTGGAGSNAGTTTAATIDSSGNLVIGGTATKPGGGSWAAPSSRELKQDVTPYDRGLAAVLQLNPIAYRYNGKGGLPTSQVYAGFIAEDVEPVMPEMVGSVDLRPDDAAAHPDQTAATLTVPTIDTSPLIFALVNAVKELNVKVEALSAPARRAR